jgi:nicotinate-nucleotide adenylyltransferase
MRLDRVLFMPAAQPPHKATGEVSRATDRLLMTRLAIEGNARFELCPIELERPGPSYTVDSLAELLRMEPEGTELFLVMAADSLAAIDTWREPDRILELAEWIVGPRPDASPPDHASLVERFGSSAGRIHLLDGPALAISSTVLRARVAAGHAIDYLVPRAVEALISERGLYRS